MTPPINIDGSTVDAITIDGTEVTEVTADGEVVFGDAIPDTGLDHLWWGPSISSVDTFPDEEGALDLLSGGNPQLTDINGNQAVAYDGDDDHTTGSAPGFGTNDVWTAAAVIDPPTSGSRQAVQSVGTTSSSFAGYYFGVEPDNSQYVASHTAVQIETGGSLITDPQVIVATYDGSNIILDANKTEQINVSISAPNTPNSKTALGQRGDGATFYTGSIGSGGHEAAAADATRRDELADTLANDFDITI